MSVPPKPLKIAVIAFDGISLFHLSVPGLIFGRDRTGIGIPPFDYRICSSDGPVITADNGLRLDIPYGLEAVDSADVVIVPSWRQASDPPPRALLDSLRRAEARGAIVVGLCLGAFPLAAAGLLAGRRATTHWRAVPELSALCPSAEVVPDALYVDTGQIVTSAGVSAGLDCCLHLLRRFHGAEVARLMARQIVLAPHRQGGQAQFIDQSLPARPENDRFDEAIAFARANLDQPLRLDDLAERAHLTRRTFSRRFRQRHGTSFGAFLARERIVAAQRLLETSDLGIERIAEAVGFGTSAALRQRFSAVIGASPSAYRRQFAEPTA